MRMPALGKSLHEATSMQSMRQAMRHPNAQCSAPKTTHEVIKPLTAAQAPQLPQPSQPQRP